MDLVNLSLSGGGLIALMGYCVVFLGLVLLMIVVMIQGKLMAPKKIPEPKLETPEPIRVIPASAPGSAGDLKLYDTDPRDAAMIMAIVADSLGKPINELRFISIKEVKEDEI